MYQLKSTGQKSIETIWKQTIANTLIRSRLSLSANFRSVDTLIAPSKLKSLIYENPKTMNAGLDVYQDPVENHDYVITVDVARGVGEDFSAFIVVDITEFPHKV